MRDDKTLIDDALTLGGNLLGNLLAARGEIESQLRQRTERMAAKLDLVSRAEFDAAFAMLAKARNVQEEILERLDALEAGKTSVFALRASPDAAVKRKRSTKATKVILPSVKKHKRRRTRS